MNVFVFRDLIETIRLPFRKDKELYLSLRDIIGFLPRDISYYKMALMHKSVMHRNKKGKPVNNERLEFLGDAILDAAVGDIVYHHFPGKREGFSPTRAPSWSRAIRSAGWPQRWASASLSCRADIPCRTIATWAATPLRPLWELSTLTEATMPACVSSTDASSRR